MALFARLPGAREPLWLDELFSLAQSGGHALRQPLPIGEPFPAPRLVGIADARPWTEIVPGLRTDNHPPLYFLVLRAWREASGDSVLALRSLSILFSLVSILLLFDAVRHLDSVAAGLWAAALLALAGPGVYYAREVRSYALLVLFLLGAAAAAARLKARGHGRWRATALAACALGACLSHYEGAGFLLGLGAWIALTRFERGGRGSALLALPLGGAAFLLLWGPTLWEQASWFGPNNAWNTPFAGHEHGVLARLLPLPVQVMFTTGPVFAPRPALLGAAWLAAALLAWRRPETRLWAAVGGATLGWLAVVDAAWGSSQLCHVRYALPATPAACALVAGARFGAGWRRALPAAAVALGLACVLPVVWRQQRPASLTWGREVRERAPGRTPVALHQRDPRIIGALLEVDAYAWTPERRVVVLDPSAPDAARAALGDRFVVLSWRPETVGAALPGARLETRLRLPGLPWVFEGRY